MLIVIVIVKLFPRPDRPTNLETHDDHDDDHDDDVEDNDDDDNFDVVSSLHYI